LNLASNVRDLGAQGVRTLLEAIDFHPLDLIEHGVPTRSGALEESTRGPSSNLE
jgi:hypothetical protein